MFRAPAMLLPHESTVAHEQRFAMDDGIMISRSRLRQEPTVDETVLATNDEVLQITQDDLNSDDLRKLQVTDCFCLLLMEKNFMNLNLDFQSNDKGSVPHTRPHTPQKVTHNHDEDYSDEESDPNAKSDEDRFNHSSSDEK